MEAEVQRRDKAAFTSAQEEQKRASMAHAGSVLLTEVDGPPRESQPLSEELAAVAADGSTPDAASFGGLFSGPLAAAAALAVGAAAGDSSAAASKAQDAFASAVEATAAMAMAAAPSDTSPATPKRPSSPRGSRRTRSPQSPRTRGNSPRGKGSASPRGSRKPTAKTKHVPALPIGTAPSTTPSAVS